MLFAYANAICVALSVGARNRRVWPFGACARALRPPNMMIAVRKAVSVINDLTQSCAKRALFVIPLYSRSRQMSLRALFSTKRVREQSFLCLLISLSKDF